MRKRQKEMIEGLLSTVEEAHEDFKTLLKRGQKEQALSLLSDCQKAAVVIGNTIEEAEGKGNEAVSYLEAYYEQLYQAAEELTESNNEKAYKQLKKSLRQASNYIREWIPVRYEVVFLPYKASMWDSLESIWLAAKKDVDVDCHVISIPYYDKSPEGKFIRCHNEKELFPKYVPMTDYRDYKIEERKPDVIFIHNPYDEFNKVTSVHPDYYSSRLREFTDMLVYVPYFIAVADVTKIQCTQPGVVYSNATIVQSDKIRQIYIRELASLFELKYGEAVFDKKILALGSPKIDKVIKTRKEDIVIPDEWKETL